MKKLLSAFKQKKNIWAFEAYAFMSLSANTVLTFHEGAKFGIVLFLCAILYCVHSLTAIIQKRLSSVDFMGFDMKSPDRAVHFFFLFFSISLAVSLLWFAGRYPGSFSYDSINQINQALSGKYSDWHPVLHTLLFFTLPLKLTNSAASIVVFQIIFFSLLMGYVGLTTLKYGGGRLSAISMVYILASPYVLNMLMYPWKDVAFAISSAIAMIFLIRCYFSNGECLKRNYRIFLFALMLSFTTIFRHNGVLFTAPLLVALFFFIPKRKWIYIVLLSVTFIGVIRGPLYSYYNVQSPGNRVTETVGLPMSIILNTAKESPECLDEEMNSFVHRLTEAVPDWQSGHSLMGGFNSVKFKGINTNVIEDTGRFGVVKMAFKSFIYSPSSSFFAVLGMISSIYGININSDINSGIEPNNFGISWKGLNIADRLEKTYCVVFEITPLKFFLCTIGFPLLSLLCLTMFKLNLKTVEDRKKVLLSVPIWGYTIGTSLFWFGLENRFFLATYLCAPLVAVAYLSKKEVPSRG